MFALLAVFLFGTAAASHVSGQEIVTCEGVDRSAALDATAPLIIPRATAVATPKVLST
jgi:hypothetical protein